MILHAPKNDEYFLPGVLVDLIYPWLTTHKIGSGIVLPGSQKLESFKFNDLKLFCFGELL